MDYEEQIEDREKTYRASCEEHMNMVHYLSKPGGDILESLSPAKCHLWHAASLAATEAGEILDAVKKHVIYEKDLDRDNIIEELGDLEFAMEMIRRAINVRRDETLRKNIDKLMNKRYPNGYTNTAAIERADKAPVAVETDALGFPADMLESDATTEEEVVQRRANYCALPWTHMQNYHVKPNRVIKDDNGKKYFIIGWHDEDAGQFRCSDYTDEFIFCINEGYDCQAHRGLPNIVPNCPPPIS